MPGYRNRKFIDEANVATKQANEDPDAMLPLRTVQENSVKLQRNKVEENIDAIPKDTGWAWMCCLGCFIQCSITIGGIVKCFGIMYVAFMEHFQSQATSAAWIIVLLNVISLAGGSYTNALSLRFSSRAVVFAGGLFMCGGLIASRFATTVSHLFLTYGVLLGMGSALCYPVSTAHMGLFFEKRRAIAYGLALSGVGVGNIIIAPILRILLDTYGLQGALLVMGGVALNICVAGALLRPVTAYKHKVRNNNRIYTKEIESKETNHLQPRKTSCKSLGFFSNLCDVYRLLEWSLLRKPSFVLYGFSLAFFTTGFPIYYIISPAYIEYAGHSRTQAAFLISIGGLGDVVGRLVFGFIADCHAIPTSLLMAILLLISSVCVFITPFINNLISLGAVAFTFATLSGPIWGLNPVVLGESYGVHRIQSSIGIIGMFMAVGSAISPPMAGLLMDQTGNWKASFLFAAAMLFLCALTLLLRPVAVKLEGKRKVAKNGYHLTSIPLSGDV